MSEHTTVHTVDMSTEEGRAETMYLLGCQLNRLLPLADALDPKIFNHLAMAMHHLAPDIPMPKEMYNQLVAAGFQLTCGFVTDEEIEARKKESVLRDMQPANTCPV